MSSQAAVLVNAILAAADPASPYLFPGRTGVKPLSDIKKFWASIVRETGVRNYRRHDNRHTFASHLVSSEIVGRLLCHTTPTTTLRYAHLADNPLREATEQFGKKIAAMEVVREVGTRQLLKPLTRHQQG